MIYKRTVADLDIHKDSVFLYILNQASKIFETKYGIAKHYFSKSRNWIYQRINDNIINGKPEVTPKSFLSNF